MLSSLVKEVPSILGRIVPPLDEVGLAGVEDDVVLKGEWHRCSRRHRNAMDRRRGGDERRGGNPRCCPPGFWLVVR